MSRETSSPEEYSPEGSCRRGDGPLGELEAAARRLRRIRQCGRGGLTQGRRPRPILIHDDEYLTMNHARVILIAEKPKE